MFFCVKKLNKNLLIKSLKHQKATVKEWESPQGAGRDPKSTPNFWEILTKSNV